MIHYIFNNSGVARERAFATTFDAYQQILAESASETFVGARLERDVMYVNLNHALIYCDSVKPVKEYLEQACLSDFDDEQIINDVKSLYGISIEYVPNNWKNHMKEYADAYDEWLLIASLRIKRYDNEFSLCNCKQKIILPNDELSKAIWEAVSYVLNIGVDDCGANPTKTQGFALMAGAKFLEVSILCKELADKYKQH